MRRLVYVFVGVLCLGGASLPPVAIEVSPRITYAPATIRIRASVSPDAANRSICAGYDGPESAASCWEADASTPRTKWVEFRSIPAGAYTAFVEVRRAGRPDLLATTQMCVVGRVSGAAGCFGGEVGGDVAEP